MDGLLAVTESPAEGCVRSLRFPRQLSNPDNSLSSAPRSGAPRRPLRGACAKGARGGIATGLAGLIASYLRIRSDPG